MEQHVGPTTFLMYNTGKVTVIIVPWRARSSGESLDTSECRVLDSDNRISYEVYPQGE